MNVYKTAPTSGRRMFWGWAAVVTTIIYISWRIFFTLPDYRTYGWLAAVLGVMLAAAECTAMLEGTEHFIRLQRKVMPEKPQVPEAWYPEVDVLIATHNEEPELLFKTVNGCIHMDYPDKSKVHIYLCDDSSRPEVAKLAADMGVGYCAMKENRHAKAGNLNNAMSMTDSPWIVTLDADMIPMRGFLTEVVPYIFLPVVKKLEDGTWAARKAGEIDASCRIGFIQTPQSFYNPDLFQFNFFSEKRIPNEQDFFFKEVNVGRNKANAPIYAGSNTLLSRQALEAAGGFATGTITEDFETGLRIQSKGYTCYAIDKTLAHGLAPTDVGSLIRQRIRWGRGCIHSLRRVHILLNPGLKLNTKLSYLSCLMYWWTFFRRFVYIAAPILAVTAGIPVVVCSLDGFLFIWLPSYLLYNQALKAVSGGMRSRRWSNIIDTTMFPHLIVPIFLEAFFFKQRTFHVTDKKRVKGRNSSRRLAILHMVFLLLDMAALVLCLRNLFLYGLSGGIILACWLAANGLDLIMAIFFMTGRKNLRTNDRFDVHIPAEISYMGNRSMGVTENMSETGLSIMIKEPVYVPYENEHAAVQLRSGGYKALMECRAVHVRRTRDGWCYGLRITALEGENKRQYYQMLYDRHHGLAKQIHKSAGLYRDIWMNIQKRFCDNAASGQMLPEVRLDMELETLEAGRVRALECDYEFFTLEGTGGIRRLTLRVPEYGKAAHCVLVDPERGRYRIENKRELLLSEYYGRLFGPYATVDIAMDRGKGYNISMH